MNRIKCIILLFVSLYGYSQQAEFTNYKWVEDPSFEIDNSQNADLITLEQNVLVEFIFDKDDNFTEYYLEHKVVWLNSDEAIEDYNKVYIPYNFGTSVEKTMARVINSEGDVIVLDDSKVLSANDEETGRQYKFFAFEGVEKGSFVEYIYVLKRSPEYTGKRLTLQGYYPKQSVKFDLYAPKNLIFDFKSYNGLPAVQKDTLNTEKNHWTMTASSLQGLEEEEFSVLDASKGYLVFKLSANTYNNKYDFTSYANVARNLYNFYNQPMDAETEQALDKFIAEAGIDNISDTEAKLRQLEYFIKTNVYVTENSAEELKDLSKVLTNKVASEAGILKLYISLYKKMNVNYELVVTSDRSVTKFDQVFEAYNFLTDFLFYFPDFKTYLSPTVIESRYGFPPAYLTDNYGLFVKEVEDGQYKTGSGEIKYIDAVPASRTVDKMIVDVSFDPEDIGRNIVKLDRSMGGYYAMYIQPFVKMASEDDRKNLVNSLAENLDENVEITASKLNNQEPTLFGVKPLQFLIDFESEAFVEKAGRKYLFKVGDLIGEQVQMYQEKQRVLPVEGEFNRSYFRTINVTIPDGYKVVNLDDIIIDNKYSEDGEEIVSFHSYYELNGNILKITANEHYRRNRMDLELFEEFRTVINSAADFNKITLVLEPIE